MNADEGVDFVDDISRYTYRKSTASLASKRHLQPDESSSRASSSSSLSITHATDGIHGAAISGGTTTLKTSDINIHDVINVNDATITNIPASATATVTANTDEHDDTDLLDDTVDVSTVSLAMSPPLWEHQCLAPSPNGTRLHLSVYADHVSLHAWPRKLFFQPASLACNAPRSERVSLATFLGENETNSNKNSDNDTGDSSNVGKGKLAKDTHEWERRIVPLMGAKVWQEAVTVATNALQTFREREQAAQRREARRAAAAQKADADAWEQRRRAMIEAEEEEDRQAQAAAVAAKKRAAQEAKKAAAAAKNPALVPYLQRSRKKAQP